MRGVRAGRDRCRQRGAVTVTVTGDDSAAGAPSATGKFACRSGRTSWASAAALSPRLRAGVAGEPGVVSAGLSPRHAQRARPPGQSRSVFLLLILLLMNMRGGKRNEASSQVTREAGPWPHPAEETPEPQRQEGQRLGRGRGRGSGLGAVGHVAWRGRGHPPARHPPALCGPFVLTHVIWVCDSRVRMRVGVVRPTLAPPAVRALDGTPSSGTSQTCV